MASGGDTKQEKSTGGKAPALPKLMSGYRKSSARRAGWQLINTLLPYCGLWVLMVGSVKRGYPYAVTLALALAAAGFLVRLFILFHDCAHGSLFPTKRANALCGRFLGVLVFTAFEDWQFSHLRHHATYANLDARGLGDIWTMTRAEYDASSRRARLLYRLYRNPIVLFGPGVLFNFLLHNRIATRKTNRRERRGVWLTNLLIVAAAAAACWLIGWRTYLLIQLPVAWMAGTAGVWLFYVQHQFTGVYWARKDAWDPVRAATDGSSFYCLPAVLRWFSGSIGYHHVHHLSPLIPNYRLKECYDAVPELQARPPLTLGKSLSTVRLKLWDEERGKLVGFR
jgi:omega-6 fatty acid desaturase (delta-12 desaturase)